MPRPNRRRSDHQPLDVTRLSGGMTRREQYAGAEWFVRTLTGGRGGTGARVYRCPGCQQELPASVPHVVVWPAEGVGGLDQRRHWHAACWANRQTRAPRGSYR